MGEEFQFEEEFYPVPPAAADADPAATMRELFYRVSRLEQSLEEERIQARDDAKEILLDVLSLYDAVGEIVERWGVTTKAQEASLVGSVVGFGKKLLAVLERHRVKPIETLGKPLDPTTSDVVDTEVRQGMPADTVLREEQIGYTWPNGLLRRAKVVISEEEARNRAGEEEGGTAPEDTTMIEDSQET
ncbi:MAG: nucleotide exchange factor GrpE [Chloroflexota bacterium]|nr:nucleotide exchange factor GrpE [Chloroflexota bacterium]